MPPRHLTNFQILKYKNEQKINCVYSRNSLPKIKDRAYVIILDEYKPMGTHWLALYLNNDNVI